VCGLSAALMLARDGHEVSVFERDGAPVPDSPEAACERWERDGVTQFRQAHFMQPGGRAVLEEELPDVLEALERGGAEQIDLLSFMPPMIEDRSPRAGDERFVTVTARRPVIECALAQAAAEEPRLDVRRGAGVRQLTLERRDGAAHVTGIELESGETHLADLVVDAMGRASPLPRWLHDAGVGEVHEEGGDSGFIYYTRYFRSLDGSTPQVIAPLLTALGTISLLTIPADSQTWSVTTFVSSGDKPLKAMREETVWTAVVKACPLHAHWLAGEPVTDVIAMGGIMDRRRSLLVDGRPLATGVVLLADAWACTNPSLGRGMTLGLLHARGLRDVAREHLDEPARLAQAWDAFTEERLAPWYLATLEEDRSRLREIEALRAGREPEPPSGPSALRQATIAVMLGDADLFRSFLDDRSVHVPLGETLSRDGLGESVLERAAEVERLALPGPSREDLLALVA